MVLQKNLSLFTLIWLASLLGYNAGNNFSKEQIRTSKTEIHRLNQNLEVQSRIETQLQEVRKQLQEKET